MTIETLPFGAYQPTRTQKQIMRLFHGTPLGTSRLRRWAVNRFKAEAGNHPVDAHLFGLKVRFHPQDNQTDSKGAVCGSVYNADELRWLRKSLPRHGTFVDVGANMGFFSLYATKRSAKVVAIEPLPELFERLRFNLHANGMTAELFNEAAGPSFGQAYVRRGGGDLGGSSVASDGHPVAMRPLGAILTQAGVSSVDLLKIDVEGFEDRVLCPFFEVAPAAFWPAAIILEHSSERQWTFDLWGTLRHAGYRQRARNRANLWMVREP